MWSLYRTPWDLDRLLTPANIEPTRSNRTPQQKLDGKQLAQQSANARTTQLPTS
jgi:hypothetical protein